MSVLVLKLGATGDVVRTTSILHRLPKPVTWITAAGNRSLLPATDVDLRCLSWEDRHQALDRSYELVINLEDELDVANFAKETRHARLFGAYTEDGQAVRYTNDASGWFDMSLLSVHGRDRADELKLQNRRSYQDLIFEGLGYRFDGEPYCLPAATTTDLSGDVAMAPVAGAVWPMKNWAYYPELKHELEKRGLTVNILPTRPTLLEHLGDIQGHRCLVGGDSLPMHLALGSKVPCVTIFNCTSPWEIFDYGLLRKIVSPRLGEFFYQRGLDPAATTAVSMNEVLDAVLGQIERSSSGVGAQTMASVNRQVAPLGGKVAYVLVTPAYNEAEDIGRRIKSVITQTVLPQRWVIVSDGSTDSTGEIVRRYLADHPWMELIERPPRHERHFAGKVEAFNEGYERVQELKHDVIGCIDADVSFGAGYMEFLVNQFADNPALGVAGTDYTEGEFHSARDSYINPQHVNGGCQLFRRECFEEIDGYVPNRGGGIDWIAVTTARMKGWETRSFSEHTFCHHRPIGTAESSVLGAKFHYGKKDYFLGGHPLWELFRGTYQMAKKPYVIGGLALLFGYFSCWTRQVDRPVSDELMRFHRAEQMARLRGSFSVHSRFRQS